MMRAILSALAMPILALAVGAAPARAAAAASCDRACLDGFVTRYLQALVAHDPHRLPLAADVKFTENGQRLRLGDALWATAEGLGSYRLDFDDPQAGEVGAFATVKESGRLAILALRLKIRDRKIAEIETLVARKEPGGMAKPEALVDHPIFTTPLPPGDRPSRAELVRIANSYFEGLEHATDKLTPFDPRCTRIENGMVTANDPAGNWMSKLSCGAQFATGFSKFITRVRARRFPVVDVARGLVYAEVFFDHAGIVKDVTMTNGKVMHVPPPFDAPFTLMIGELFKIEHGRIRRVEAVLLSVPYGMPSGWGPDGSPGR